VALASLALALMLLFIASTDYLAGMAGDGLVVNFILIMLGYFGVRFFGQGILTSAARNVLLLWFEKRRGLVSSVRGVFVSLGFSLAPLGLAWLIGVSGWREALALLALSCAVFAVAAYLLLRDNPASCGVHADGHSQANQVSGVATQESATFDQAKQNPVFWIYSLSLAMHALFGTAVTFHIVSIFAQSGRSATEAFAYFLPAALVSTSVNLVAGWLADSSALKPFLVLMLVGFVAGAWGLLHLDTNWGYWMLIAGFGAGGGLWSVTSNLAFIRNFGPLHLGEISGLCTATMVFASAIGPALFSLGLDVFGTYAAAEWLCLGALLVLLFAAVLITHPDEHVPRG
jgi:OFA family oxalate/formate antiporter-like MFS transporter